jgi:glycine cleavage system H protein
MTSYKGCRIPEELLYDLEFHVWVKVDGQTATVGVTDPAQAYAGEVIYIKVKEIGTKVERGAILATVESAKYMGPIRSPLSGIISEVNAAIVSTPSLINQDSYLNWVARLMYEKLDEELKFLIPGNEAAKRYKSIIDEWDIKCEG